MTENRKAGFLGAVNRSPTKKYLVSRISYLVSIDGFTDTRGRVSLHAITEKRSGHPSLGVRPVCWDFYISSRISGSRATFLWHRQSRPLWPMFPLSRPMTGKEENRRDKTPAALSSMPMTRVGSVIFSPR